MKLILSIITLILLSVVGIPQSFAEDHLDFEHCNNILVVDEVNSVVGDIENLTESSRKMIPTESEPGLKTMCTLIFESSDKSIRMTLTIMDSVNDAINLYEKNLNSMSTQEYELKKYVTFWNNFEVVLNDQGLGSMVISQYDKFFINFHTVLDEENKTLADIEQLRVLSSMVQKKILDLDEVPISPPNPIFDDSTLPDIPPSSFPDVQMTSEVLSPKKQLSQGIEPSSVKCRDNLVLIVKMGQVSSACVRSDTADILSERGWGFVNPPCCKK